MISGWNSNSIAIFVLLSIGVGCSYAHSDPSVYFSVYTPSSPIYPDLLATTSTTSIPSTSFSPSRPTVFFIHGYQGDRSTIDLYRDTYLQKGDYNFIVVDWVYSAGTFNYITAKKYVPFVGGKLANVVDMLVTEHGLNTQNVTFVGHSLGK